MRPCRNWEWAPIDVWLVRELDDESRSVFGHDDRGIVAYHIRRDGTGGKSLRLTPQQFLVERQLALRGAARWWTDIYQTVIGDDSHPTSGQFRGGASSCATATFSASARAVSSSSSVSLE